MTDPVLLAALGLVLGAAVAVVVAARRLGAAPGRGRVFAFCAATSVFACALGASCYAPRVALWRALLAPPSMRVAPEVCRGHFALLQYADLGLEIENPMHRVIRWRLLPPLVGRALGLPGAGYLALSQLACFLVVGFAAWLVWRDTRDRRASVAAAVLVATSSWFFAATGWLAYFDSWCVLAMLAASLIPHPAALVLACLLAPWVDERFTVCLPVVLAVRWAHARELRGEGALLRDALVAALASAPYLGARAAAFLGADAESRDFVQNRMTWTRVSNVPRDIWPRGAWHGLRAFWAAPAALLVWPEGARAARAAVLLASLAASAVLVFLVADISRAMSMLLPAALLGLIAAVREAPRLARAGLVVACALNVFLPARHVLTLFEVPIENVAAETRRWRSPPAWLTPEFHAARAAVLRARGAEAEAREHEEAARALAR